MAATTVAVPACSNDVSGTGGGGGGDDQGSGSGSGSGTDDQWQQILNSRTRDYPAALRIAAIRLTGTLPTSAEINSVASATGDAQKTAYEALINQYVARPTFARQMMIYWRNTMKIGGSADFDTAPAFAAELTFNNGSYLDMFTKASGNCPTYDDGTMAFADAECMNGGPKAGVLTNPGVMSSFYSNFAFRRVRWVQEVFDCLRFPAEVSATPQDVGGGSPYTGVWPFNSISGTATGGRVNFEDVTAQVCANCHTTLNHIAPLFAQYDDQGQYQSMIVVPTPLDGSPVAMLSDYLPATETTAWRYQEPAADLPTLGTKIAADTSVQACGVARMWNFALGVTDIVDTLQDVPLTTIQSQVSAFQTNGFKMRDMVVSVFTSDDFTQF
ncbi:MAG TPA: hypothetical protein VGM88_12415 [Kofleriaceae bacterium]